MHRFAPRPSAIGGILVLASFVPAQGGIPGPTEVLMFKSGHSYTYREASLEAGATSTRLRLPDATHGSVWIESGAVAVERAIAKRTKLAESVPITDLSGILRRAVGREVRLSYVAGDEVQFTEGEVLRVLDAAPLAYAPGWRPTGTTPPQASLLALRERDSVRTLQIGSITSVAFAEQDSGIDAWEYSREVDANVLDVVHTVAAAGDRLGLASMSRGLAWTPSYVIVLGATDRARLAGKAVLVNDAEPLEDTRVRLAIGFPNLEFAGVDSSLSPSVTLDAFRNMLSSGGTGFGRDTGILTQALSNVAGLDSAPRAGAGVAAMAGQVDGESSEDLYLYDIGRVTLDEGERAYMPLLDTEVTIAHRFDWDLPDRVSDQARFTDATDDEPVPVWHVLKLDNETDAPWTTAPVMIQNDRGPIAQSMLRYTAPGADATVRLTKALDLVGSSIEVRADDARSPRDEVVMFQTRYERVEVVGVLELTNRSKRAAPMRIRKHFSGDLVSADHEPELTGRAKRLGQVNASRTATWSFELAPGEAWKSEYRYRVLIRR